MHLWVRAEERANERRCGVTPDGVAKLIDAGLRVTVERSDDRVLSADAFAAVGAELAAPGSWRNAPSEVVVFGLKELPDDGAPLLHRHIMFGHAFKGQPDGPALLRRFAAGGGALYDLEYLVDESGRRVAAFGYWAGFVGAAVTLMAWAAQARGEVCGPVDVWLDQAALVDDVTTQLGQNTRPDVLVIGALGRVGSGASDLCRAAGCSVSAWDMAETASGGPFPEILAHDVFLNCILAGPGTPVFVPGDAPGLPRRLTAIGDIACDPGSDYNPVPVYYRATGWDAPVLRVATDPVLDVMAIDNLPSLLPRESSEDFAAQLLPHLKTLSQIDDGVWGRARATFDTHMQKGSS